LKILPLKGYKSLRALNAFHALLLGLKMLPAYIAEDYETFYARFQDKEDSDKERFLREAAVFVQLSQDEVESLVSFATDRNNIPYSQTNLKNLNMDEIHDIIVAVCMEIGRIKIELVTEDEKKNSLNSA
jgi:flagellar motor switch/type III secretory pathway protein FliN